MDPAEYMRSAPDETRRTAARPRVPAIGEILRDAFMVAGKVAGMALDKLERSARAEERQAEALERIAELAEHSPVFQERRG
jgi:hypothetical protein